MATVTLSAHQNFEERNEKLIPITAIIEDLPELHNEVIIDETLTDSNGIPSPKVNYTTSENSKKILDFSVKRCEEVLGAAGAYKTISNQLVRGSGWHLMGTTKMGESKINSVVNKYGRSHDVKNLYVIDGSVFVTSGAVNPTSTIQAISLFIAENIKTNSKKLLEE